MSTPTLPCPSLLMAQGHMDKRCEYSFQNYTPAEAHTEIFYTTFFAIILNPTSTGCLLRVQASALGAPEIASQATHFKFACYLGFR